MTAKSHPNAASSYGYATRKVVLRCSMCGRKYVEERALQWHERCNCPKRPAVRTP